MTSEELYYDHYKDTFAEQKGYLARRNKLTLYLFLLLMVLGFQLENPQTIELFTNKLIVSKVPDATIGFDIINLLFELLFLWVVVSYYQVNFTVERTYKYIHAIEAKLSSNEFSINREGKDYKKDYPFLLTLVHWFYIIALPILVIVFSVLKIIHCRDYGFVALQIVVLAVVIIFSILYIFHRCFHKDK
jgi:hypothetical protein